MKKLICIFLVVLFVFTFAACSQEDVTEGDINNSLNGSNDSNIDTDNGDNDNTDSGSATQTKTFDVAFYDENGKLLTVSHLEEGKTPAYTYTVSDTAEWKLTFKGWASTPNGEVLNEIPAVQTNANYFAIVSKIKQKYTVGFDCDGKASLDPIVVEYGTTLSLPTNPVCEGFRFTGWFVDKNKTTPFDKTQPITANITLYASWNVKVDITKHLQALLIGYKTSPYSFIPQSLQPSNASKIVTENSLISDYSEFVSVSKIKAAGFGEQWNMVVDNINQSTSFHNVLSVIDTLSSTAVVAYNNYLDSNPSDATRYEFTNGIYNIAIKFDGQNMFFVVDYTADLPVFKTQMVQIAMSMDVESGNKTVRIQIGDANAMAYTIKQNEYIFAIKYLGVRRAYFSVTKNENGDISGHIYEYLVAAGKEIESAADFYIEENYAYVVGNKADAFIGSTGYICEVYDVKNGDLVGYEVEETISKLTFNTLWFDLNKWNGLTTIKYTEKTETEDAKWFVNGSSEAWKNKKVGGLTLKTQSRRFDLEFRTQYFYIYNETDQAYEKVAVQVPMLFIQEEVYDDFVSDVKQTNKIDLSCNMSNNDFTAITASYDLYVAVFKTNKDLFDSKIIEQLIGEKITLNTDTN